MIPMKRLQIMIESDLDAALQRRSAEDGISRAAIIRRLVRDALQPERRAGDDPLGSMIGADDYEPGDVDAVVYR